MACCACTSRWFIRSWSFIEGQRGISISNLFTIHVFDRSVHWSTSLWSPHTVRRYSTNLMGIKPVFQLWIPIGVHLTPFLLSRFVTLRPHTSQSPDIRAPYSWSSSLLFLPSPFTMQLKLASLFEAVAIVASIAPTPVPAPASDVVKCAPGYEQCGHAPQTASIRRKYHRRPSNRLDLHRMEWTKTSIVRYATRECGPRRPANWLWGSITLWFLILKDMDKHAYLVNSLRNSQ